MAKCLAAEYASRAPTPASRSSAATATPMEYDMQRYWRDVRLLQIGPITNEMAATSSARASACRGRSRHKGKDT